MNTGRVCGLIVALVLFPCLLLAAGPDSVIVGVWQFDEASGSVVSDSSPFHNDGYAYGTSIIMSEHGYARTFNGHGDYVEVPNDAGGPLSFAANEGFRIEVWFRTDTSYCDIIRKGLAPVPGYMVVVRDGHLQGMIGDQVDGLPPSGVVSITSTNLVNDGRWHSAAFIRDRQAGVLRLYIDDREAAAPVTDHLTFALRTDYSLYFGRWANLEYPEYFRGAIDKIRITKYLPQAVQSDTVALWHFEDSGNMIFDASPHHSDGTAYGTNIVPGKAGYGRMLSGFDSYITIPNPSDSSLSFSPEQSFTIQAWFKTTFTGHGWIMRKGLAPVAGFAIGMSEGRVHGTIGNREDGAPPDTLLRVTSERTYNDGQWHQLAFIRDRQKHKLLLFIDGVLACPPADDFFPYPLASNTSLTMGRWEYWRYPEFFAGTVDEIGIFLGARYPSSTSTPQIQVSPSLSFGLVPTGSAVTEVLTVSNLGGAPLQLGSIQTNNPAFLCEETSLQIDPYSSSVIHVSFTPATLSPDSGVLSFMTNDPHRTYVAIALTGTGCARSGAPVLVSIADIPNDEGRQVRLIWNRSKYDGLVDSFHVNSYGVWRRVEGLPTLWDYIGSVPAVKFEQYSYVAPTLRDSSHWNPTAWSVFKISAHFAETVGPFFSEPDSGFSVDNRPPAQPKGLVVALNNGAPNLQWERLNNADLRYFAVFRGKAPDFPLSDSTLVATTISNNFTDQTAAGNTTFFYRVAAVDSAGNRSVGSDPGMAILTGVNDDVGMPISFALEQNYPNPFNPTTEIMYQVPVASVVRLSVYNILGQEVALLMNGQQAPGRYTFRLDGATLPSGVYLYRLQAHAMTGETHGGQKSEFTATKKMMLLK